MALPSSQQDNQVLKGRYVAADWAVPAAAGVFPLVSRLPELPWLTGVSQEGLHCDNFMAKVHGQVAGVNVPPRLSVHTRNRQAKSKLINLQNSESYKDFEQFRIVMRLIGTAVPIKSINSEIYFNIDNIVPYQLDLWANHQSNRPFTFRGMKCL